MSAGKFKIRSRAFGRGFIDGFGSPLFFFVPRSYPRAESFDPSLIEAWDAVSKALQESEVTECERIGKAPRKILESCHAR